MAFNFKKKFGQNFLRDKNLLAAIVSDAKITEEDEVLEIGAGEGSLTEAIASKAKKVVSYEIDKELEKHLIEKFPSMEGCPESPAGSEKGGVVLFRFKDALKTNISEIEKDFTGKYKLVANLPYYITTPLIFKFLEETDRLLSLTIMVQKEVAERIVATPKDDGYGILSVMMAFYGKAKITRIVKRNMFHPMPDVDSAIINLEVGKHEGVDKLKFSKFVRSAFAMKRKTLVNNLSQAYGIGKDVVKEKLVKAGLGENARAEDLTVDKFIKLFKNWQV